jgi:hypothetical protein
MAGLLTYFLFERLPEIQWQKYYSKRLMKLTAAGLLPIFTAFPFNHFPRTGISEPM